MRWIARYVPEFEKRWNRFACRAGASWRVDETYVKIKGRWTFLYRAVDKQGKTVDFLLRGDQLLQASNDRGLAGRRPTPHLTLTPRGPDFDDSLTPPSGC
jgi:hypothetical protein